jgi:hypothetical protein
VEKGIKRDSRSKGDQSGKHPYRCFLTNIESTALSSRRVETASFRDIIEKTATKMRPGITKAKIIAFLSLLIRSLARKQKQ